MRGENAPLGTGLCRDLRDGTVVTQKIMPIVDKRNFMKLKVSAQQRKRHSETAYRMRENLHSLYT